ncbi:hypothetical protein J2Z83_003723 [Virgibacillus natechei]|uniref:Uncharacterized protein n=1 Tax=Virgibacillus natechei TaxID=1216297 RepID=A0ABS4IKS1_9BACI|nr:hypothetical protein [Virgibacillus natechei]MBP1971572.1 hypothetical protein [Virgibacillus natechei]UZD13094.1 hypothetical protein OLD84_00505 [Virgibacillus natechei]
MNNVSTEPIKRTVLIQLFHVSSNYSFISPVQSLEKAEERKG